MIKKLLLPIDGSSYSLGAFNYGLALAKELHAKVEVLFIVDRRKTQIPFIYAGGAYDIAYERIYIPPDQELKKFYDRLNKDLHDFAENLITQCRAAADEKGVVMEAQVREGFPSHEIEEVAHSADLLVLGRRGENAHYKGEIIGSTTEELVRKSPRPVLVCDEKPYEVPKKILIPYDASRSAENAVQFYINEFSNIVQNLVLLCAEGIDRDISSFDNEVKYIKQHNVHLETVKDEQPPEQAIEGVVEKSGADLIIIGSHGRKKLVSYLLGSTTIHVIRKCTGPVLVVY
ncbi:MAG: universal stress protein [Spirochaetaceae bacterium]